jgi:hypothetical protein
MAIKFKHIKYYKMISRVKFNNFKTNSFVSKHVTEERNKKQQKDEFIKSLDSSSSFPELGKQTNITKPIQNKHFIDIVKNQNDALLNENEIQETNDDIPPPGCVCIKYDKLSKKTVWVYGKNTNSSSYENPNLENKDDDSYAVMQRLVNLHQNRKYDHIRKWGIDEYNKMFMYQNYDYEYFDKLDDENEKNMVKYYQDIYNLNNYDNEDYNNDI